MKKQSLQVKSITAIHNIRKKSKESYEYIKENSCRNILLDFWNGFKLLVNAAIARCFKHPKTYPTKHIPQKYAYIFRKKSLWELVLLSAAVCGIEFCYAAETAFVTPLLLSLGMEIKYVTMVWCLSPFIAFLLTPILGPASDVCSSKIGRRRPFIIGLSTCIFIGLFLVPYGGQIGKLLGDRPSLNNEQLNNNKKINDFLSDPILFNSTHNLQNPLNSSASNFQDMKVSEAELRRNYFNKQHFGEVLFKKPSSSEFSLPEFLVDDKTALTDNPAKNISENTLLLKSVIFTILGTILTDSCCDICQSPCRAYMLDVILPNDQATGLSVFSLMAGMGAGLGYVIGAIEWNVPVFGNLLEGQVIVVFAIITVVFIICLISSLCFFPELPLSIFKNPETYEEYKQRYTDAPELSPDTEMNDVGKSQKESFMFTQVDGISDGNGDNLGADTAPKSVEEGMVPNSEDIPLKEHLKSIIRMPKSLLCLCTVNFFTWMTLINYGLYFTDFMGEYIFNGDPHAQQSSPENILFKDGVRYGCWGLAFSSFSCAVYSLFIGSFIGKFSLKYVYIGAHIVACIGYVIMIISKSRAGAVILSSVSGIMYGTAFTIPYLLVAKYHSSGMEVFALRGIGTDVAAVTSMMVLSQFIVSLSLGSIVNAIGSNAVSIGAAAVASACGAVSAWFVTYPDAKQNT